MTLKNVDVVDNIGIDKNSGNVVLSIIDEHDWENENEHLTLLQEKINTYLRFIESDEIFVSYPKSKGKNVDINIIFKFDIPKSGREFLQQATEIIKDAGFNFKYEILKT